ncbi:monooxygenase family protein [Catellatospora coxensis]|uniref:DUF4188 domain-containing protein n=1 Tax=Catellatospora coxensis TaxID=310354 RepID=A0A8J3L2F4_9ACTN|nr:DUF4188 domain-containing protein [Catellatospora coxensis]GIG10573.1 hypothetical protein Cco03nite_72730 [Catellatospora coxensis]
MPTRVNRRTVDLSGYPDLVVVYLGMKVNRLFGLRTLFGFGPKISDSITARPDGLLSNEYLVYSMFPMNVGMRQYWRDLPSLLEWTRSRPHRDWWISFLRDSGGTGFWHETYLMKGGMEAVYNDVPQPIGFMRFAPVRSARGPMFGSAARLGRAEDDATVLTEDDLYGSRQHTGASGA